jgi:L-threonylcarbamoyladenylate synthase
MPSSTLALALIHLANVPIAAPSANASSKPSPTTAAHVLHDLSGRIDLILDGGPCGVGVESTVVDGLVNPPVILRPGGVSIDMLKSCPGWENVQVGYKDGAETGIPRAPGMKYKHYSPNARVLLFRGQIDADCAKRYLGKGTRIGVLTTKTWQKGLLQSGSRMPEKPSTSTVNSHVINGHRRAHEVRECGGSEPAIAEIMPSLTPFLIPSAQYSRVELSDHNEQDIYEVWTVGLGQSTADIARGLFSALRELDQKGVDVIFVEGIDDSEGDAAAAVMNRLRKAAEAEIVL